MFEDANGVDLQQFQTWYLQAGTPEITVSDSYDAGSQTYKLTLSQNTAPTPGQAEKQPLVVPVKFGLIGPNGSPMTWSAAAGDVRGDLLVLNGASATYEFKGVPNKPVPSLFREFSAPVKVVSQLTQADRLFLARHDSDPFNRWQSLQESRWRCARRRRRHGGRIRFDALARRWATPCVAPLDPAYRPYAAL